MTRFALCLAALAALPAAAAAAETDEPSLGCSADRALPEGPLASNPADGHAGRIPRACPRTELAIGPRAGAIVDEPGFYGMVSVAVELSASYALNEDATIFASADVGQFRFVQNATIQRTHLVFGSTSVGLSDIVWRSGSLVVAPFARIHLPTSLEFRNAWPVGVEAGASLRGHFTRTLEWHGGLAIPFMALVSSAGAQTEALLSTTLGAAWTPKRWFSLLLVTVPSAVV